MYATDAGGTWASETVDVDAASDPSIALDPNGHVVIAYVKDNVVRVARNATGSWVSEGAVTTDTASRPSLGVDEANHVHVAFVGGGDVWIVTNYAGLWTSVRLATNADAPSLAVYNSLDFAVAYRRSGANAGTWLTDYDFGFGTTTTTRLTRSSAESAPSLALDAANHAYVAVARDGTAANPGIYLVSNRTGSWVTTQVTTDLDANDPSIVLDPTNHASIAYERVLVGITEVAQVDPLGTTSITGSTAGGSIPAFAGIDGGADRGAAQPQRPGALGGPASRSGSAGVAGGASR